MGNLISVLYMKAKKKPLNELPNDEQPAASLDIDKNEEPATSVASLNFASLLEEEIITDDNKNDEIENDSLQQSSENVIEEDVITLKTLTMTQINENYAAEFPNDKQQATIENDEQPAASLDIDKNEEPATSVASLNFASLLEEEIITDDNKNDENENDNLQQSSENEIEKDIITLKPLKTLTKTQIDQDYSDAAEFKRSLSHLVGNGFELLNNYNHVTDGNTRYWKFCTDTKIEFKGTGRSKYKIYKCPIDECDFKKDRLTVMKHVKLYHGPEKWMCPLSLPRHVVPIIAISSKTIEKHISCSHPNTNLRPIKIHTRQITFPFTMVHKNSNDKTILAELCFTEHRKLARNFILENNIKETEENHWLTAKHLNNSNNRIILEKRLKGDALDCATRDIVDDAQQPQAKKRKLYTD